MWTADGSRLPDHNAANSLLPLIHNQAVCHDYNNNFFWFFLARTARVARIGIKLLPTLRRRASGIPEAKAPLTRAIKKKHEFSY